MKGIDPRFGRGWGKRMREIQGWEKCIARADTE